jgi:hypothetical protein
VVVTVCVGITGVIAALGDTLFPASSLTSGVQQDFSSASGMLLRLRLTHPVIAIRAESTHSLPRRTRRSSVAEFSPRVTELGLTMAAASSLFPQLSLRAAPSFLSRRREWTSLLLPIEIGQCSNFGLRNGLFPSSRFGDGATDLAFHFVLLHVCAVFVIPGLSILVIPRDQKSPKSHVYFAQWRRIHNRQDMALTCRDSESALTFSTTTEPRLRGSGLRNSRVTNLR